MQRWVMITLAAGLALWGVRAAAQTEQKGADRRARTAQKLKLEYVRYRPARWETEHVKEYESEFPNEGGFLSVYVTNTTDEPVRLRFWRYNRRDESYWVLNHFISWHRDYGGTIPPGGMGVLEINGTSKEFGAGAAYDLALVDRSWRPCMIASGVLEEDPVTVSYLRILPDLRKLEVHLRSTVPSGVRFTGVSLAGHAAEEVAWRGAELAGPGNAIARVTLAEPLETSAMAIVRVDLEADGAARSIYAHRRAFADFFPIGTWGGDRENEAWLAGDHVDTQVKGGRRDDAFFGGEAAQHGLHAMVHTGEPVNVDMVRDLSGHPAVVCWMLRDEPDWSLDPQVVLFCDTTVRHYDRTIPTFLNLCRNVMFFDYAQIADIPGHDHYCVTAPSSSKWPHRYGTRLEETAYYTRDLKYASEPKPTWVWSQGNHGGWSERPRRPVPTAEELSAQLVLNLGRGAKGILWFTYHRGMSEKYPDTRESMRGWNRVMQVLRDDLSGSEPLGGAAASADGVDAAALAGWDTLTLCVTNLNYEIDPEAYPFETQENVTVSVPLPGWMVPAGAVRVSGAGIEAAPLAVRDGRAEVTLEKLVDAAVVVLYNDADKAAGWRAAYQALLEKETP